MAVSHRSTGLAHIPHLSRHFIPITMAERTVRRLRPTDVHTAKDARRVYGGCIVIGGDETCCGAHSEESEWEWAGTVGREGRE